MDNKSSIRKSTNEDSAKLKEIIDLSFPMFFRYFANHSVILEEGEVIIIEDQGVISGFVKLIEFNIKSKKYGCILWIAVHPSYRRRGIAFNLTNSGIDCLEKNNAQAVFESLEGFWVASL